MKVFKNMPDSLKSRKFWLAVVAALIAFLNAMWDWGLNTEQLLTIIVPLLTYIGVEGFGDAMERKG